MTPAIRLRRPASGPQPLQTLLLHGVAGSPAVWDEFVTRAMDRLELWDVELPWSVTGNGAWARSGDVADVIAATVRSLPPRPDGQPVADLVVAHSFGASALLEALARCPQPLAGRVVLVSPLSCPEPFDWSEIGRRVEEFPRLLEEGIANRAGRRIPPDTQWELAIRLRNLIGPLPWLRTYEYGLRSATLDVAALSVPLAVLTGRADRVTAVADVERLANRLPNARFEAFDDCGHFPMLDRAAEFAAAVDAFVRSEDKRAKRVSRRTERRSGIR